jgi:hypothetical protein
VPVDATPAQRPSPVTLAGRYGRVERLAQHHDAALWKAVQGHDHIWTYMSYGPLADFAAFSAWLAGRSRPRQDAGPKRWRSGRARRLPLKIQQKNS